MNPLGDLQRRLLYAVGAALLATGAAWAVLHYAPSAVRLDERAAAAWAAALMEVHGAAAMLALVLFGSLFSRHIAHGWRLSRNTASGSLMVGLLLALAVTGWLLYYAGGEATRRAASWTHLAVGLAIPVPLIVHALRRMRQRARSRARPRQPALR